MPAYLKRGMEFTGPVAAVLDGDGLCVDVGARLGSRGNWVEVRLADFYADELYADGGQLAKLALVRLVAGKRLDCVADHRSHDRVVAVCRLRGVSVGDRLRALGVRDGGRGR